MDERCESAGNAVEQFFYMRNNYYCSALEEALQIYAEFHVLEGQPVEWGRERSFCQCTCRHGLPCTMGCKPSLVVAEQYLGLGLHSTGKHGRLHRGNQQEAEDGSGETAGCRDRIQQSKGYT